ncbi:uncharacterized protein FA14DRAFT_159910 [Meira miltonrushii]|uniref:Spindle assembly checkpoint component MAD1 n=1 Tax=Meira miltonrushii TaxID=1280837 RepID=A0A316VPC7_9BASI|nr:uncharacterized protein FA14DRAFT_159910 [Meira miltonrushii]PWN38263.1 hypothetical protein FA14DRAFT_159910 [Meira miltonrushii]
MDRRRSGIPGPSSNIGGIPKRAPSPSSAAFASASSTAAAGGGPLGGYRPPSRDGHADPPRRFGFGSTSGTNAPSGLAKGTPQASRIAVPPSSAAKRSISSTGIQDTNHATPNGGSNKRPFLTSGGSARSSLAASSSGAHDHSTMEAEYKRKELLAQQAYERLQQELNAKGREVEKEKEERAGLLRQWEALNEDLVQERKTNAEQKKALQQRANELQARNNELSSHIDEADSEKAKALQSAQTTKTSLSIKIAELEAQYAGAAEEAEAQEQARKRVEDQLKSLEEDWQKEREQLQSGRKDDEESAKLTKELHNLLAKIRKLEAENLTLSHDNKHLQSRKDSVEALKEQNRDLEKKVGVMNEIRRKLAEAETKAQDLENEKQQWQQSIRTGRETSAYQEAFATYSDTYAKAVEIDELANVSVSTVGPYLSTLQGAFAGLLSRSASLTQRADTLRKQQIELEESQKAEAARADKLSFELEQSKTARLKSEKAREAVVMELENYKRLLETYQQEAQNMSVQYDGASAEQIALLEEQLKARNDELEKVYAELEEAQNALSGLNAPGGISADEKNRLESAHEEREKELLKLIEESKQSYAELEKQCISLGKSNDELFVRLGRGEFDQSKLRVLELKDNPVSRDRVIRTSTLDALKKENAQLIEQVKDLNERVGQSNNGSINSTDGGMIPAQSLENMKDEYAKLQQTMRDRDKAFDRLKEVFGAKATEYVAAVKALFGYDMHVLSRGKVKLRSVYARTSKGTSLTFDAGEDDIANMRLIGEARQGAANVANLKRYWLNADRCSVPCFLAALQLELYESTTQAVRVGWTEGDEEE